MTDPSSLHLSTQQRFSSPRILVMVDWQPRVPYEIKPVLFSLKFVIISHLAAGNMKANVGACFEQIYSVLSFQTQQNLVSTPLNALWRELILLICFIWCYLSRILSSTCWPKEHFEYIIFALKTQSLHKVRGLSVWETAFWGLERIPSSKANFSLAVVTIT